MAPRLSRSWYNRYLLSRTFWNSFSARQLLLFEDDCVLCPAPHLPLHSFSEYAFVGAPFPLHKRNKRVRNPKNLFVPAWCFNLEHCVGNSGFSLWRRDVIAQVVNAVTISMDEYKPLVLDYLHQDCGCLKPKRGGQVLKPSDSNRKALKGRTEGSISTSHVDVWFSRLLQALRAAGRLLIEAVPNETVALQFAIETTGWVRPKGSLYWVEDIGNFTPVGVHKAQIYLMATHRASLLQRCPPFRRLLESAEPGSLRAE